MATNKVTTNVIDMSGDTGGLVWAKGTQAQRPTGVAGDLRLNTTDSRLEYRDNSDWKRFSEGAASGPTIPVDFLVVAGGGSGGADSNSGGGGAGGLRTSFGSTSGGGSSAESSLSLQSGLSYTVTVGAGAPTASVTNPYKGSNGSNSVFSSITSLGGGGGVGQFGTPNGLDGGSGGGGAYSSSQQGGSGAANQGFDGGGGSGAPSNYGG